MSDPEERGERADARPGPVGARSTAASSSRGQRPARTDDGRRGVTSVYLASPLAYALPGRIFQRRTLVPALVANDFEVRDPWRDDDGRLEAALGTHGDEGGRAYAALAASMAARNAELLRGADAVLAVLDGAAPDAGVAAEVGAASALGIPVVGWRSDIRAGAHVIPAALRHAIEVSGGSIHATLGDAVTALVTLARTRR